MLRAVERPPGRAGQGVGGQGSAGLCTLALLSATTNDPAGTEGSEGSGERGPQLLPDERAVAAADEVHVIVRGVGGHGSAPEKTRDPVPVACEIVLAFHTAVTRQFSVWDPVVLTVGKVADLVLVEGDPSQRLSDLRQTRVVMLAGKLLDADALRAAAGFSGRPK